MEPTFFLLPFFFLFCSFCPHPHPHPPTCLWQPIYSLSLCIWFFKILHISGIRKCVFFSVWFHFTLLVLTSSSIPPLAHNYLGEKTGTTNSMEYLHNGRMAWLFKVIFFFFFFNSTTQAWTWEPKQKTTNIPENQSLSQQPHYLAAPMELRCKMTNEQQWKNPPEKSPWEQGAFHTPAQSTWILQTPFLLYLQSQTTAQSHLTSCSPDVWNVQH